MRQLIKILFTLIIFCSITLNVYSAVSGGIEYSIPIDYNNLNEAELKAKADSYYGGIIEAKSADITIDTTQCLVLYTILSNKCPENIDYALRLGKIYDIIGKDRLAKGNYYRAMGIDKSRPEPYYYLGDYYFDREQYRRALKMYIRASEHGYSEHPKTTEKINTLRKMLGEKD